MSIEQIKELRETTGLGLREAVERLNVNKLRVLVVWNEIPEEVTFLKLEVDAKERPTLERFHNNYVNGGDDDKLCAEINDYFYKPDGYLKFEKITEPLVGVVFDLVIITGFIL